MSRVLNVLYDERIGGPPLRVLQVAQELRKRGVETEVVIPRGDSRFAGMLSESDITYHHLKLVRLRQTLNPWVHAEFLTKFWPNVMQLRRLIRIRSVDIVHTNGLMNTQAAVAARLEGVRLVWHLNDTVTPGPIRTMLRPLVRQWSSQIAVAAHAVGEYYFDALDSLKGQLKILYAPVDTLRFSPLVDGSAVREEFGLTRGRIVIGNVANFDPSKGHACLIEAATIIKKRFPESTFLLVGQRLESRREYWRTLTRRTEELGLTENVHFVGGRSDMPPVYRTMNIYVHPSKSEACPMAVLEASASGLPVVATDVGGVRELVSDGETGIVVRANDPRNVAEAVIHLLENPELARKMGIAAAERMRKLFSLEACVEQHMRIYQAALQ